MRRVMRPPALSHANGRRIADHAHDGAGGHDGHDGTEDAADAATADAAADDDGDDGVADGD